MEMRTFLCVLLVAAAGSLSTIANAGLIEIEIDSVQLTPIIENSVPITTDGWLNGNITYDTSSGAFSGFLAWSGNRIDNTGVYTVLYDIVNQPPGADALIRFFNQDWASADWQVTAASKSLFVDISVPIAAGELPFVLGSGEWLCDGPDDCAYFESRMEVSGVARAAGAAASDPVSVPEPGTLGLLCAGLLALSLRWRDRARRAPTFVPA